MRVAWLVPFHDYTHMVKSTRFSLENVCRKPCRGYSGNMPQCQWHHIHSEKNPADCASRGMDGPHFMSHSLWRNGPRWLKSSSISWPCEILQLETAISLKEHVLVAFNTISSPKPWDLRDFLVGPSFFTRLHICCVLSQNFRCPITIPIIFISKRVSIGELSECGIQSNCSISEISFLSRDKAH